MSSSAALPKRLRTNCVLATNMYTRNDSWAGGECIKPTVILVRMMGKTLPTMEMVCVVLGVVANHP